MVRHDDRFPVVPARDNYQQVAFVGVTFLIIFPTAERRKIKIRIPVKRQFPAYRLFFHPGGSNCFLIPVEQVVSQFFQVSMTMCQLG